MRPTTGPTGRALPALLAAAVAAVVLGILGMHALNLHGTTTMSSMAGTTGHHEVPGTSEAAELELAPVGGAVAGEPAQPGHGMGDMVMLCAAMLAVAGLALLTLLLLHRVPRSSWSLARWRLVSLRGPVPARTGSGPPSVWAFSVIRC